MIFYQIIISYCKFIMPKAFKWCILGVGNIIASKDIHQITTRLAESDFI